MSELSEETGQRIAKALERLAEAMEANQQRRGMPMYPQIPAPQWPSLKKFSFIDRDNYDPN